MARPLLLVAAGLAMLSCTSSGTALATGAWGGGNAELQVTSAGAQARFTCGATGTIGQSLRLDAGSAFDLPGSYAPLLVNTGPQAARYRGSVSGSAMTLDVSVGGQSIGTFQLTLGRSASFDVCNL